MEHQRIDGSASREGFAEDHGTTSCRIPAGPSPPESWFEGKKPHPLTEGIRADHASGNGKHDQPMPSPDDAPSTTIRPPGILVVDDDIGIGNLLQAVLRQQGFMVRWADSGLHALEIYQELRPEIDLVLLDVRMPELDGPQTLTALQQLNAAICCCFMSGDTGVYTEQELLECGAVHVFQKPFHLLEVVRSLWHVVNSSEPPGVRGAAQRTSEGNATELMLG